MLSVFGERGPGETPIQAGSVTCLAALQEVYPAVRPRAFTSRAESVAFGLCLEDALFMVPRCVLSGLRHRPAHERTASFAHAKRHAKRHP